MLPKHIRTSRFVSYMLKTPDSWWLRRKIERYSIWKFETPRCKESLKKRDCETLTTQLKFCETLNFGQIIHHPFICVQPTISDSFFFLVLLFSSTSHPHRRALIVSLCICHILPVSFPAILMYFPRPWVVFPYAISLLALSYANWTWLCVSSIFRCCAIFGSSLSVLLFILVSSVHRQVVVVSLLIIVCNLAALCAIRSVCLSIVSLLCYLYACIIFYKLQAALHNCSTYHLCVFYNLPLTGINMYWCVSHLCWYLLNFSLCICHLLQFICVRRFVTPPMES